MDIKTDAGMQYVVSNSATFQKLNIGNPPFREFLRISPDGVYMFRTGWLQRRILSWLLGVKVGLLKD